MSRLKFIYFLNIIGKWKSQFFEFLTYKWIAITLSQGIVQLFFRYRNILIKVFAKNDSKCCHVEGADKCIYFLSTCILWQCRNFTMYCIQNSDFMGFIHWIVLLLPSIIIGKPTGINTINQQICCCLFISIPIPGFKFLPNLLCCKFFTRLILD